MQAQQAAARIVVNQQPPSTSSPGGLVKAAHPAMELAREGKYVSVRLP